MRAHLTLSRAHHFAAPVLLVTTALTNARTDTYDVPSSPQDEAGNGGGGDALDENYTLDDEVDEDGEACLLSDSPTRLTCAASAAAGHGACGRSGAL